MSKYIYVRISNKDKTVQFADKWEEISNKPGKKKKFLQQRNYEAIKFVMNNWSKLTENEVKRWDAPKWLKDRYLKIARKNKVHVTIDNEGCIIINFEINNSPIKINKSPMFFELYDKYLYIYEKILFICEIVGINSIEIYTDLVELLRLNRLYWNNYNKVNTYVKVVNKDYMVGG